MYKPGDEKIEVRELLVKAFASAWEVTDRSTDRDGYINSSIAVVESLQITPDMLYGEEGQGLLEGTLDHLEDWLPATGVWVYYAVPAENFFLITRMEDAEAAAQKVTSLREEGGCLVCLVDVTQQWVPHHNTPQLNIV